MDTNARADLLYKFAQLIEENREVLATIETWDNGKPYSVSLNDDLGEVRSDIYELRVKHTLTWYPNLCRSSVP